MGIHHTDGYSASVEAFFVVGQRRIRLAKTNGSAFMLAEFCELPPDTEGDLLVIIDNIESTRRVQIPRGIVAGQTMVNYEVAAPF